MSDWTRNSQRFAATCGLAVCAIGGLALLGWAVDDSRLMAVAAGIVIKTNTAVALLAAGLSLFFSSRPGRSRIEVGLGQVLAVGVILIGLATLSEHLFGWDLHIDQSLFREEPGAPATTSPNRMGPPASICLPLFGFAMLWLDTRSRREVPLHQRLALAGILIALLPTLGYFFQVHELYGLARFTGIALNTAVALIVLGVGVLFARPEVGIARRSLAHDAGGVLLRRMIPAAILLPILLGLLRLAGEQARLFDTAFGLSILIFAFVALFSGFTWWTASALQRQAAARSRAEAAERELSEKLAATLESERSARALAERSNRLKDEFLATVSHELRTPLSAITGWVQLLMSGMLGEADRKKALDAIHRNSRLQADLVNDLLDMSRIEAGTLRLEMQDVDLTAVAESAIAAASPAMDAKGLVLERRLAPDAPIVRGDPVRLQQVVGNLISNAVKFTPRGGRITVSLSGVPGGAELSVRDTGIGISPELTDQIFDRFRQVDASTTRSHSGLGLGLSIARQLMEMHGGTLVGRSDGAGQGSTFTMRVPSREAAALTGDPAASSLEAPLWLAGVRVLVVDDSPDVCELAERMLATHGAQVTTAGSVDEAVAAFDAGRFDVLVSDISMPARDGYDLIRHVRALDPHVPAIALTAFARPIDAERVLAAGFQRHLTKPITPDRIVQAVAELRRERVGLEIG